MRCVLTHFRCLITIVLIYFSAIDAFSQWTQSTTLQGGSIVSDIVEFNGDLYISVLGAGIHRSTDNGETWQKLSVPPQGNFVHFTRHNTELLAISHSKLFRTSNGNDWNEEDAPAQFVEDVSSDGTNIFIASSQGLFKSADGGVTWVKNPEPSADVSFSSVVVNGSTILAGVSYPTPGAVLKSVNGGITWTSFVISANNKVRELYFQGSNVYANVDYLGVYKSTDNGTSWQSVRSVLNDCRLLVTPTSIYSLSNYLVSVSTNGGISWSENSAPTPSYFGVVMYATTSNLFVGSIGGGVFRNNVSVAESWATKNTGLLCFDVNDIAVVDNTILLATENSFIRSTTNEGNTWTQLLDLYGRPSNSARTLLATGNDIFVSDQGGGGIYRSSDGGATWSRKNEGIGNQFVSAFANTNTLLVLGTDASSDNGVYISVNRGDSWTKKSYGISSGVRCLYSDGINIYAGTWSGLFKSANQGETWTRISTGLPDESIGYIVSIGPVLYAATQFNGLYKTVNNGEDWQLVNNNLVYSLAARKNVLFLGTLNNKFLMSVDSGKTWIDKSAGLPDERVTAINFTENNLVVGSAKSGAWFHPLTQLLPPTISFYSAFPDSTFKIGGSVFVSSDQELRKTDGSMMESTDLFDYVTVKNSDGVEVQFQATIDDKRKLITITIDNAVDNETYTIVLESFKNVSGLATSAMTSYPFMAVLNHVPSLAGNFLVQAPGNETIQFTVAQFSNAFSDLDDDELEKIKIVSLPQNGTLKLGSTQVSINDEILIESVSGLNYTADEDFEGFDQWKWNGSDGKAYAKHDATVTVEVRAITGIPESSAYNFNLYPNPILNVATIDLPEESTEAGVVLLFDLNGREIKKLNFSTYSRSFDFSDVSKGVYVIKLIIQGKNFQQKVVKL